MALIDDILNSQVIDGRVTSQSDREQVTCLQKIIMIDKLLKEYNKAYEKLTDEYNSVVDKINEAKTMNDESKTLLNEIEGFYPTKFNKNTLSKSNSVHIDITNTKTKLYIQPYTQESHNPLLTFRVYNKVSGTNLLIFNNGELRNGIIEIDLTILSGIGVNNDIAFMTYRASDFGTAPNIQTNRFWAFSDARSLEIIISTGPLTTCGYWISKEV